MSKKLLGLLLIFFLIFGSGCKVIYKNRVPVTKPKKRYGWYQPQFNKRKRTKTVWMKVHKGKFKEVKYKEEKAEPLLQPLPPAPAAVPEESGVTEESADN